MKAPAKRAQQIPPGERGTPVRTEDLPNGSRRHHLSDGRAFEEDGPHFRIEYASVFAAVIPGETYSREIAIFGLDKERPHLFEGWCFSSNALRTYAFSKLVSVEEIATGIKCSGEEFRVLLGGAKPPGQNEAN